MDEPRLLVHWEALLGSLLDHTARFPRNARFTFAARIDQRALDILECLAAARYAPRPHRIDLLTTADRHLSVLRVLLRVAHSRRLLSTGALGQLTDQLGQAGQMLGAWRAWLEAP